MTAPALVIGSRGSDLALWQAKWVQNALRKRFEGTRVDVRIIKTKGDRILDSPLSKIGDKGLFTREIENALLNGEIDIAVHSLKDLPTELPQGLIIGAMCEREDVRDVFIPHPRNPLKKLLDQVRGSTIATGSLRRRCQLLYSRPDFQIVDVRGNLNTRVKKLEESDWAGMILARAGVVPKLGNNPLAVAVPAGNRPPIIFDMACSQVARGNLILASKMKRTIPPTWALDARGRPTEDPDVGLKGSLMPVGGHKGSGLALIIGILGGLLAGSAFGAGLGDIFDMTRPQRLGHLVMAIHIEAFCPLPEFLRAVEAMIDDLKSTPRAEGVDEIWMPGEMEMHRREEGLRNGFPVSRVVLDEVRAVGALLGVPWPV